MNRSNCKNSGNNRLIDRYRETLKVTSPPCIPHVGVFLKELTYIEETHFDSVNKRLLAFCFHVLTFSVLR
jgi:hypothetical protein